MTTRENRRRRGILPPRRLKPTRPSLRLRLRRRPPDARRNRRRRNRRQNRPTTTTTTTSRPATAARTPLKPRSRLKPTTSPKKTSNSSAPPRSVSSTPAREARATTIVSPFTKPPIPTDPSSFASRAPAFPPPTSSIARATPCAGPLTARVDSASISSRLGSKPATKPTSSSSLHESTDRTAPPARCNDTTHTHTRAVRMMM